MQMQMQIGHINATEKKNNIEQHYETLYRLTNDEAQAETEKKGRMSEKGFN